MSASIRTEAIVLRNRRFSETSLVVTLLGRDCGRLDVLAKGCRREKSPLYGHLDLYQREEVLVLRRSQASLDLLIEAAFLDEHIGLRFSPEAFAAAGFLADFAAVATLPGEALVEFYDVFANALGALAGLGEVAARAGLTQPSTLVAKEKRVLVGRILKLAILDMLGWLGFGLELRHCVMCGVTVDLDSDYLGLSRCQGGLVCAKCRDKVGETMRIRPAALDSLRHREQGGEHFELALPDRERQKLLRFLADYCQHALEKPLRGRKVLFQILG